MVLATARALAGEALTPGDRRALRRCLELLRTAASSDLALRDLGMATLADATDTIAVLQAAGGSTEAAEQLRLLSRAIRKALQGDRSDETLTALAGLRDLFLAAGRASLAESVRGEQERERSPTWPPLTVSSDS